jgi:hypothetical protein
VVLPEPDKYRRRWSQPTIGLSSGGPRLDKGLKELRGVAAQWREQQCQQTRLHGAPGDWTSNQRVHIDQPIVLATHVAEDGLVGHQWEEMPLGLRVFDAPGRGMPGWEDGSG